MTLYFTTPTGVGEFDWPPDNPAFETAQSSSPKTDLWWSTWSMMFYDVEAKPRPCEDETKRLDLWHQQKWWAVISTVFGGHTSARPHNRATLQPDPAPDKLLYLI